MEHFDLTDKRASVLGDTPAADAIADAYTEAGATVTRIQSAAEITGPLEVLATAPDLFLAKPMTATTDVDLEAVFVHNFANQFAAVRAARAQMTNGARIVLVTSVLGERGLPNCSAYAAAHGAVQNLIRAAAQEFAPDGISVNGIELGWMDWMSDRIDKTDEEANRAIRFTILKRAGKAEEIGPLAVWLSGTGAGFVTGQIYPLDGGLTQHL